MYKEVNGKRCEPIEELVVDVPEEYMGSVMEKMGSRKGELQAMQPKGRCRCPPHEGRRPLKAPGKAGPESAGR